MSFGRFFLPGPTEVRPEVLAAMTARMIGHRGPAMSELLRGVDPGLRAIFRTRRPVYVASASATGLMEASIRNGVRRRALALVNGAFSDRYRELVADCGRDVESYEVPWGEAHDPEALLSRLRTGSFDAVTVVHSETSTGVLNPLPALAEAVREAERASGEEILLLVDAVTSVAGAPVESEAWGLDFVLTGSQKAMALPPGLAFGSASPRMLDRAATLPGRGQYFDLPEYDAQWARHQTPNTPALPLIYALAAQVERIGAEGIEARWRRHEEMSERCLEWASGIGLEPLPPPGRRSPTVSSLRVPHGRRGSEIAAEMETRGYTIAPGYGKLKDSTIRIGHMGDHTMGELETLLGVLAEVLDS